MSETDQKRKLACDSCKRKKLKCEWEKDSICVRCSRVGSECIPQPSTQRKKREKKPNTYLSSLEDRLERMESAMTKATMAGARRSSEDMGKQAIVDNMSMLKIKDNGTALFVGSASGFSIFSPQGLKWISDKTGNNDFAKVITNISGFSENSEGIFGPSMWYQLSEDEIEPLPPIELATSYIDSFFRGFGSVFPLFDQLAFEERVSRQYPVTRSEDVAWYACLNIVFGIGLVMDDKGVPRRTSQNSSPMSVEVLDAIWWKWLRNACSTFIELQFREGSLAAVQAMVGMSFLLQILPNPYPCSVVAGAALRLAQAIGLHRNMKYTGISAAEVEQRRNAFWIGLLIERGVTFRMGRPSVIHEDDIGIDLPGWSETSEVHSNHLRYISELALLQGRIYNKFYSAKSLTKSAFERLQWVGILDEELQHWRDSIPVEIRPGNEILASVEPEKIPPILVMHFGYFNALTIIHRTSNHHGPWTSQGENPFNNESRDSKMNPRVFAGGAICVSAARSAIGLLNCSSHIIDSGYLNIIRVIAYFPLTASLTLFANILQNPWDPQALQDIELMKSVTAFLSEFFDDQESLESAFIIPTFMEINRVAAEFVKKSQMQGNQPPKRSGEAASSIYSKHAKSNTGIASIDKHLVNKSESESEDRLYVRNDPSYAIPSFDAQDCEGVDTNYFPITATPSPLPMPPQPLINIQQVENDPLKFLDENAIYSSGNLTNGDQTPEWMETNTDGLFMPQDASWFFPISIPWDAGDQIGG